MDFLIICIITALFIGVLRSDKKKKKVKQDDELERDMLIRKIEIHKAELEERIAEREALLQEKALLTADDDISDDMMLITKEAFEEMCSLLKETFDMIMDICREKDFQTYILSVKRGSDRMDNSQKMFESLKFFIIKDVLKNYEHMGHSYFSSGDSTKKKLQHSVQHTSGSTAVWYHHAGDEARRTQAIPVGGM